jgi:hypothetical protein
LVLQLATALVVLYLKSNIGELLVLMPLLINEEMRAPGFKISQVEGDE